jgi:hypothetical protein
MKQQSEMKREVKETKDDVINYEEKSYTKNEFKVAQSNA